MTPRTTTDQIDALRDITTDIVDILKGYAEMQERAETDLLPVIQRLHALHETHAAELMDMLDRIGGAPEDAGSAMGLVHKAVATARDWAGALDATAIPQIVDGEKQVLSSYDRAVEAIVAPPELVTLLDRQRTVLAEHVHAIEHG